MMNQTAQVGRGIRTPPNTSLQRTALSRVFQEAFLVCSRLGGCWACRVSHAAAEFPSVSALSCSQGPTSQNLFFSGMMSE